MSNGAKTLTPGACDCGYKHWNDGEEYDFIFYFDKEQRGIGMFGDDDFQTFIYRSKLDKYINDMKVMKPLTNYFIIKKREYEAYMNSLLISKIQEEDKLKNEEMNNKMNDVKKNNETKKEELTSNDDDKKDLNQKKIKKDHDKSPVIVSLNFESKKPKKKKKKDVKEGKKDVDESNEKVIREELLKEEVIMKNEEIKEDNKNVTQNDNVIIKKETITEVTEKISEMSISNSSNNQTMKDDPVNETKQPQTQIKKETAIQTTYSSYSHQRNVTSSKPIQVNEGGIKTLGDFKSEKKEVDKEKLEHLKRLHQLAQLIQATRGGDRSDVLKALMEMSEDSNDSSSMKQYQTSYYLNNDEEMIHDDEEIVKQPIVLIEGKKTTQIKVKLHNNSTLNVKLNLESRLIDLIQHIAYCTDDSTPFTLSSNIPNVDFNDKMKTIEEMGIANSLVIQRLIKRN